MSGNVASFNNYNGIYLNDCNNNTISGNIATNNQNGICLNESDYNIVSENFLFGNDKCILEDNYQGNEFSDNGSCTYG